MIAERASTTFTVLPAIDLRNGAVVRLEQGRFDRERVYAADAAEVAGSFREAGATWLHVVDLDAARTGARRESATIAAIARAAGGTGPGRRTSVEVAGGLRDSAAVAAALGAGAARVVVGTAAIRDRSFVSALVARHGPEAIAVALDIRDGVAVGEGWVRGAERAPWRELLARVDDAGAATVIVTAIARDGLLGGPDVDLLREVVDASRAAVIASGGIRSTADLLAVREIGCSGAIVGRALYDGSLDLAAAIATLGGPRDLT